MRPPLSRTLLLVLPLWVGSAALAQAPATPTPGEIKAQREFKLLDFNGDGQLSRSEVRLFPRLAASFEDADTDGDGFVSYEEVRAFAAKVRAQRDRQKAAQAAQAGAAHSASPTAPDTRP